MRMYLLLLAFLLSFYSADSQQKESEIVVKAGPGFIISKEKEISSDRLKHAGLDFSLTFRREKKVSHTVVINFLSTHLGKKFGPGQEFNYKQINYGVIFPVVKKEKLIIFVGSGFGASVSNYIINSEMPGSTSAYTGLFPVSQKFTLDYKFCHKVKLRAEYSVSLVTGILRAGYANYPGHRDLVFGTLFNNNYITSCNISITNPFSKRIAAGLEWQNYFHHVNYPSSIYSNSQLRNSILFSMHYKFK